VEEKLARPTRMSHSWPSAAGVIYSRGRVISACLARTSRRPRKGRLRPSCESTAEWLMRGEGGDIRTVRGGARRGGGVGWRSIRTEGVGGHLIAFSAG
jgi:hypothetical protein